MARRVVPFLVLVCLVITAVIGLLKTPPPRPEFTPTSPRLPHYAIFSPSSVQMAATRSVSLLEKVKWGSWHSFWPSPKRLMATSKFLEEVSANASSPEEFFDKVLRECELLSLEMPLTSNGILVTGYFFPSIQAAFEKGPDFTYPLYGTPKDLVRVPLRRFDPELPDKTLWIRVSGIEGVPYYTRKEIDSGAVELKAPVLAWLPSVVEGIILHIQGSGRLHFQNGATVTVHYEASNGHPYKSIGRVMVERGILHKDEVTLQAIVNWLREHPEEGKEILEENPRYIFFRYGGRHPVGSYGAPLAPMHSVALDPAFYPPGAPMLLILRLPGSDHDTVIPVFNFDTGAAIKGPRHVDLFCGEGDEALELAGRLKAKGRLYLLLKK